MRRLAPVLGFLLTIILLIQATGCSGGAGGQADTATKTVTETAKTAAKPTLEEFVQKVVSDFGPEDGFAAVALAYDNGYALGQIVDAAMDGKLTSSGEIPGVVPEYAAAHRLSISSRPGLQVLLVSSVNPSPSDSATAKKLGDEGFTSISRLRAWLAKSAAAGEKLDLSEGPLYLLVELMSNGFSAEQIYEAFIFGYEIEAYRYEGETYWRLRDERGNPIDPAHWRDVSTFRPKDTAGDATPDQKQPTATSSGTDDYPRYYKGKGTVTIRLAKPAKYEYPDTTCVTSGVSFEAELKADGTVMVRRYPPEQHPSEGICKDTSGGSVWEYRGRWTEKDTFSVIIRNALTREDEVYMEGKYDEDSLRVDHTHHFESFGGGEYGEWHTWKFILNRVSRF